jgi:hypothetical protein
LCAKNKTINQRKEGEEWWQEIVEKEGAETRGWRGLTDQTEEAQDAAEHLHDEDLHEQGRIRGVCQGCSRAGDAHGDTAEQVTDAHRQTAPEERIAWCVIIIYLFIVGINFWRGGFKEKMFRREGEGRKEKESPHEPVK